MQADAVAAALAQAHRTEWAFVLSATVRVAGDLDLAEECAQEAYVSALQAWTRDGVPERPGAWLTTAARNKARDRLRREITLRRKLPLLVEPATVDPHDPADPDWSDAGVPDDRLRLVFTCCHPTLAPEARVALTLRLVCGVPTPDVARAFLVSGHVVGRTSPTCREHGDLQGLVPLSGDGGGEVGREQDVENPARLRVWRRPLDDHRCPRGIVQPHGSRVDPQTLTAGLEQRLLSHP